MDVGYAPVVPDDSAIITDGTPITILESSGRGAGNAAAYVQGGAVQHATLGSYRAVVVDGDPITIQTQAGAIVQSGTAVFASANAYPASVRLPATTALVANAQGIPVVTDNGPVGEFPVPVAANAPGNLNLSTVAAVVLKSKPTHPLYPASGTSVLAACTVSRLNSEFMGLRLPATSGVVTNGQTIAVSGGTVTIAVTANVVTAAFTAD